MKELLFVDPFVDQALSSWNKNISRSVDLEFSVIEWKKFSKEKRNRSGFRVRGKQLC